MFRTSLRTAVALAACATLGLAPAAALAEYDDVPPSLSRAEALEAAEDALIEQIGDDGEIRSLRCQRTRRSAARCDARGVMDAVSSEYGTLRWKAKLRVRASLDAAGEEVVSAEITSFDVGFKLTRQRAEEAASQRVLASVDGDVQLGDVRCRLVAPTNAKCVAEGLILDPETGTVDEFEARVRVTAAASDEGAVRIRARITSFASWPLLDDSDDEEPDFGGGFGVY